jgi:hypothetical protein
MRLLLIALALAAASCSPPAATTPPAAEAPPSEASGAPPAPAVDLGPYTNNWDAAEFSRFRHIVHAAAPGAHNLRIDATTNSTGGETVAVYPLREDGSRGGSRIVFVIADTDGQSQTGPVTIPEAGLPVEVVVENAAGRRHQGNYTLTVE